MKNKKYIYEILMSILPLITIFIMILEFSPDLVSNKTLDFLYKIDGGIYIIFVTDYFIRLALSYDKINFIKKNKIDLISIIPLNSLFKAFRIFKLIKVLKLMKLFKVSILLMKFKNNANNFIKTNHFNHVLVVTLIIILMGAFSISLVENISFSDSLWWSFVTTTTVGYGDIYPSTELGRVIACILMMVGIGFIGMLTGTISTYFLSGKDVSVRFKNDTIESIKLQLDNLEELSEDDIDIICNVLKVIKSGVPDTQLESKNNE